MFDLKKPVVEAITVLLGFPASLNFGAHLGRDDNGIEYTQLRQANRSGGVVKPCQRGRLWVVALWLNLGSDRIRTSMSHGRPAGRGFDSRQVHQIALGGSGESPANFPSRSLFPERYCGPDPVSTDGIDGGKLVPGVDTPYSVYQTKKAKSILAKVAGWFKMPSVAGLEPMALAA